MDKIFAIGDIHGQIRHFKEMLNHWNPDNQQLILLGDLIDRGEDSFGVVHLAKELKEKYGAVILTGNHEQMFLDWLKHPYEAMPFYYKHGGRETIHSFFDGTPMTFSKLPEDIADLLTAQFTEEINFMSELPRYFEWGNYVFVHAGVDLTMYDWKATALDEFLWIRNNFHEEPNNTDKTFIFGHTPTQYLNTDGGTQVWLSPCHTKIGIDGGAVFGGQLHGIQLDKKQAVPTIISIDKGLNVTKNQLNLQFADVKNII